MRWDEEPSSFHSRFSKHLVYVSASSNNNKYGGIENFIRTGHCHLTAVVQCFSWDLWFLHHLCQLLSQDPRIKAQVLSYLHKPWKRLTQLFKSLTLFFKSLTFVSFLCNYMWGRKNLNKAQFRWLVNLRLKVWAWLHLPTLAIIWLYQTHLFNGTNVLESCLVILFHTVFSQVQMNDELKKCSRFSCQNDIK